MNTETATAQPRLDYRKASKLALPAMLALQNAASKTGLEPALIELVKLRASQINNCAFCMDMHFREARAAGEREERLVLLSAWEELEGYTPRERAALRWTEALTRLADHHVSDALYEEVGSADLTVAEALCLRHDSRWRSKAPPSTAARAAGAGT